MEYFNGLLGNRGFAMRATSDSVLDPHSARLEVTCSADPKAVMAKRTCHHALAQKHGDQPGDK
jgi:hypothetical protein